MARSTDGQKPRRSTESAELKRQFEPSGKRFSARRRTPPWKTSRNYIARSLSEALVGTHEPIFADALLILAAYGFFDAARSPARNLKALGTLIADAAAVPAVEQELERQRMAHEPISERRACEKAAATGVVTAPNLEAARVRVRRAYLAHKSRRIPSGDVGRELLIARIEACPRNNEPAVIDLPVPDGAPRKAVLVGDLEWVPDDRFTRTLLWASSGGSADDRYVVLAERGARLQRSP